MIGIPEILLNIVSCYGFIQDKNSTLLLTCRIKLVSHYLSRGFLIIEQASQALKNFLMIVQNHIHAIIMYDSDSIMICSTPIPSVSNTLKRIYLNGPLWYEFTSQYYNEKNETFGLLFQQYKASDIDNIYYLSVINEWKYNIDK